MQLQTCEKLVFAKASYIVRDTDEKRTAMHKYLNTHGYKLVGIFTELDATSYRANDYNDYTGLALSAEQLLNELFAN